MIARALPVVAVLLALGRVEGAQQDAGVGTGGKITWQSEDTYDQTLEEARKSGKPVILYFTASWSGPDRQLGSGAFSDDRVLEASWGFVRIISTYSKQETLLTKLWKVTAFPTLVFLNPDHEEVDRWVGSKDSQNPETIAQLFKRIQASHSRSPLWSEGLDAALRKGRSEGKPVLAFWTDGRPDSDAMEASFTDKGLNALRDKFVWVRLKHRKFGDAEARRYDISKAPLLLAIAPGEEDASAKVIGRFEGTDPASLKKALEDMIK